MDKSQQLDWIPIYIDKILGSPRWNAMKDYQKGWYFQLLLLSVRSERPGYLRLDSNLWSIAGAKRRDFFDSHKSAVMACFKVREIEGQTWLFNERLILTLEEQHEKIKKRPSKNHSISISPSLSDVDLGKELLISQNPSIDINMAGRRVMEECGLAGDKRLLMVTDAVRSYCKISGVEPEVAALSLIARWKQYESDVTGQFKCRVDKFFEAGVWQYPEKWQEMAQGTNGKGGMDEFFKKYRATHAGH